MDAFQQAQASELLQTTIGACAITASFVDPTGASENVQEPGIGHGPLKDFMLLAGQGILEQPEGASPPPPSQQLPVPGSGQIAAH